MKSDVVLRIAEMIPSLAKEYDGDLLEVLEGELSLLEHEMSLEEFVLELSKMLIEAVNDVDGG